MDKEKLWGVVWVKWEDRIGKCMQQAREKFSRIERLSMMEKSTESSMLRVVKAERVFRFCLVISGHIY